MPNLGRRQVCSLLAGGAAAVAMARPQAALAAQRIVEKVCTAPAGGSLRAAACAQGRLFGTAVVTTHLEYDPPYRELVARECAVLVPEWQMKWGQIEQTRGVVTFQAADQLADFARQHGMKMRGHTLIWYRNMPKWLPEILGVENWQRLMADHFARMIPRYRDVAYSWDVVNEAVEPEHGRPDGMRNSPWLRAAGVDYVAAAFKEAARHAPEAELVYNDYGVEHDDRWNRRRRVAVLKLLERAKAAGAPIHALGMQSHLRVGDGWHAGNLVSFLREVEDLGIKPIVTELEIRTDRVGGRRGDEAAAALARDYLETVLANSRCDTVITWCLSDKYSWRRERDPQARPLLFDDELRPKPLYDALAAVLAKDVA
ncbi:endo-1,4-beta-xylanase [Telmatospirillum sp. J64-1]|uniref:endo-1,4-beta-xylanase n=1 Tax=Telmatospirillum sp. J64-1 TaxID=2502183 RepID=UPI00115EAD5D|nr:endo-1,4-beta-xylanase [Telmatospirillum sp. J64-1]